MKRGDIICNTRSSAKATVKWAVDFTIGILHDNGESEIFDTNSDEGKDWTMLHESAPLYQTSVEHMTDEQLRMSIDDLRNKRIMRPESKTTRVKSVTLVETPEQKQLKGILGSKTPAEKEALMRKLGLLD